MTIKIHRGAGQIGGSLIEISTENTRILLDAGCELDEGDPPHLPPVDGLFDHPGFDAVFLSHYHPDHMGLAAYIHPDIPVYIGQRADAILCAAARYRGFPPPRSFFHYQDGEPVQVGEIAVTPFLNDHSAFDSYMLLCEGGGKGVLYTGDFRSGGRKAFDALLRRLPKDVDTLLCEGTTLGRERQAVLTEWDLETQAVKLFQETTGPVFALTSAMNIDRLVTIYRATKRSGRLFFQDLYTADIATAAGESIPSPRSFEDVRVFITRAYPPEHPRYSALRSYGDKRISRVRMGENPFVMCVRTSMGDYLEKLRQNVDFTGSLLVYSLWEGYKQKPDMAAFLARCESWGLQTVSLHISGHADAETIQRLIDWTKPHEIMPVHTENPAWFEKDYGT